MVAVIAFLSPWISTRVLYGIVPAVILEILLGFVIGPNGFHLISSTSQIEFLSNFGFSYLMFLSGIELDFDILFQNNKEKEQKPWLKGVIFFVMTFLISYLASYILFRLGMVQNVLLVSLILSATSIGIVTPTLKNKGWLFINIGQKTLLYALIADLGTLTVFAGYITIHSHGGALGLLSFLGVGMVFILIYRAAKVLHNHKIFHYVESATSEFGLRASIALILVFLAFSQELGLEVMIGAFLAGAIISLLSEKHSTLHHKLNTLGYGFLLPIFFVHVGMEFQIQSLQGHDAYWLTLIGFFLVMYLNKLIPTFLFVRKEKKRYKWSIGIILSSRLSLTIVASQIGQQTGTISSAIANGLVLLAVLSSLLSPVIFNYLLRKEPDEHLKKIKKQLTIDSHTLPEGWIIEQLEVKKRETFGKKIRKLNFPHELLIISISREDGNVIPKGETRILEGDMIQVLGDVSAISQFEKLIQ